MEDDADYEPPPSNDEEALQNSILPAKPFPNSNSTYIGKALAALARRADPQEARTHAVQRGPWMPAQPPPSSVALGR